MLFRSVSQSRYVDLDTQFQALHQNALPTTHDFPCRPSTFASIIQTIQDRGYVNKRGRALVPTFLAFSVTGLLESHFTKLVDYDFTASMEEDLDKIASGEAGRVDWLRDFYYGHDGEPGLDELSQDLGNIDARATNTMNLSENIEIRVGRYGAYLQENFDDGERKLANIPENMAPDVLRFKFLHLRLNTFRIIRIIANIIQVFLVHYFSNRLVKHHCIHPFQLRKQINIELLS